MGAEATQHASPGPRRDARGARSRSSSARPWSTSWCCRTGRRRPTRAARRPTSRWPWPGWTGRRGSRPASPTTSYGRLIGAQLDRAGVRLASDPAAADHTSSANATIGTDGAASYVFDLAWRLEPLTLDASPRRWWCTPARSAPCCRRARTTWSRCSRGCGRPRPSATTSTPARWSPAPGPRSSTGWSGSPGSRDVVKASDEDVEALWPDLTLARVRAAPAVVRARDRGGHPRAARARCGCRPRPRVIVPPSRSSSPTRSAPATPSAPPSSTGSGTATCWAPSTARTCGAGRRDVERGARLGGHRRRCHRVAPRRRPAVPPRADVTSPGQARQAGSRPMKPSSRVCDVGVVGDAARGRRTGRRRASPPRSAPCRRAARRRSPASRRLVLAGGAGQVPGVHEDVGGVEPVDRLRAAASCRCARLRELAVGRAPGRRARPGRRRRGPARPPTGSSSTDGPGGQLRRRSPWPGSRGTTRRGGAPRRGPSSRRPAPARPSPAVAADPVGEGAGDEPVPLGRVRRDGAMGQTARRRRAARRAWRSPR